MIHELKPVIKQSQNTQEEIVHVQLVELYNFIMNPSYLNTELIHRSRMCGESGAAGDINDLLVSCRQDPVTGSDTVSGAHRGHLITRFTFTNC